MDPEILARLRHDLGRYVCFQARWLPDDAPDADLREALRADLLHTRRGPDGEEDAAHLWARFRPHLDGVDALDQSMRQLLSLVPHLDTLPGEELRRLAALARDVAEQIRRLGR